MKRFLAVLLTVVLLAGTDVYASAAVITPDETTAPRTSAFTSPDESLDRVSESDKEEDGDDGKKDEKDDKELEDQNKVELAVPSIKSLTPAFNKIEVKWEKVANANGYELYYSTTKNGTYQKITTVSAGKALTYVHKNLTPSRTYYYAVRAYAQKNGVTSYSDYSKVQSAKTALQPVKLKSVSNYNYKTLKLSWSKNSESTGYIIYRSTRQKSGYKRIKTITNNKTTSYKDANCKTGTKYYYKIIAYKKTSAKTYKSAASEIKSQTAKCSKPKTVTVSSAAYNKLTIKWSAVNGANGYYIYRSTSKNGKYTKVGTVSKKNTLKFTDTKRTCGKKYYYKVVAWRKVSGKKKAGISSDAKAGKAVPAAPKVTLTAKNNKKIQVSWKKVAGAESYTVLRATSKNGTYKVVKKGIKNLTWTNSGLTANKRYYYKVMAVRKGVEGKKSSAASKVAFNFGLNKTSVSVIRGGSVTVKATSSGNAAVKWSSANSSIATVSSKGKITGKKAGTTKIYAKSHGVTLSVKVKVTTLEYGIDVSRWQGNIDWNAVRNAGYTFVMMKATQETNWKDPMFEANYAGAKKAGMKVGCYAYSKATSVAEAEAEAWYLVQQLGGRKMDYPVVLDLEDNFILANTDNWTRTEMIFAYQRVIVGSGYKFALYANLNWLNNYIDNSRLVGMDIWIARYRDVSLGHGYTGGGNVVMWQHTSQGSVPGIAGNVDLDLCYKAY
ncbi:MAG: hypothetical protein HFG80_05255 [Eubacterium sp.]|nr:hypothetical protein [Eubacterium sp.]